MGQNPPSRRPVIRIQLDDGLMALRDAVLVDDCFVHLEHPGRPAMKECNLSQPKRARNGSDTTSSMIQVKRPLPVLR
jgi:hypothetical protein